MLCYLTGETYRLRVLCNTSGGTSAPSEVLVVTTPPVQPGPCLPPMLAIRPKPTCLSLKWGKLHLIVLDLD